MFNDIIVQNFSNPTHAAELVHSTDTIELGNPVCGDRIKVQLNVQDGLIQQAAYAAWGCATSLATGNVFCQKIQGTSVADVCKLSKEEIDKMLGDLEPAQHHCLEMLHNLFAKLQQNFHA